MAVIQSDRRVAILSISPAFFIALCNGSIFQVTDNPLPKDTRCVHAYYDHNKKLFVLIVQSASFDEVPDGVELPRLMSMITVYDQESA